LVVAAFVLAGCGADDKREEAGDTKKATNRRTESATAGEGEPILIRTRVDIPTGKVVNGSTIGDSPFCPGGTFQDEHGAPDIGLVDRMMTCQDGTLRMGLDPEVPVGDTQSGPWRIISGTGAYDGWQGSGHMVVRYDPKDESAHPMKFRERYRGTVTR
jgi:hypothetical protein